MIKESEKKKNTPKDVNEIATSIVEVATKEKCSEVQKPKPTKKPLEK
jgi:hypothetical protein